MANNLVVIYGFFFTNTMFEGETINVCSQFKIPNGFERLLIPPKEPLTTRLPEAAIIITDCTFMVAEYQTATQGQVPILYIGDRKELSTELQSLTHIHSTTPKNDLAKHLTLHLTERLNFSASVMARINDKIAQILSPGGGLPDQTRQAEK